MPWRLFERFVLRHLWQEKARTLTTIAGVALGIAVVVAIQLTNVSSVRGFETALDTVAGRTSVEVVAAGAGVDELRLPDLGWLREFGAMSPVIEGDMALITAEASPESAGRPRTEAVRVLGVDILRDLPFRDYRLIEFEAVRTPVGAAADGSAVTVAQFLELLTASDAIVISEKLARRQGVELGGSLRLMAGDRIQTYVVRGLLKDEGPARVLDGNFVLMDIAAAQAAFDRFGRLDRVDVLLAPGRDVASDLAAIASRLPPGLSAQRPSRRGEQVEQMLAAFHMNLTALSWIALIVGLFLVYNTVTISVIARREEIGTLRALGVTRRQVVALFLGEAAALALVGIAAGLGLARVLADLSVSMTAATVSTLYIAAAAVPPDMSLGHAALAVGIGLPLALLAAALPAAEASRVPPTAAMRGHDIMETRFRLRRRHLFLPVLLLGAAAGLATMGPLHGRPVFGYAAALVTVFGGALFVPAILFVTAKTSRTLMRRRFGVAGLLAHANLASSIPRLSISVAALAVSLSMMVAIAVMIGSFRDTVSYWVGQTLQADLFVSPGVRPRPGVEHTLSPPVVDAVRWHPAVRAADAFRNMDLVYEGNLVVLGSGDFDMVLRFGSLLFKDPRDGRAALRGAIGRDSVVMSETFANRYGKRRGETVMLPTPAGVRPFVVAAIYFDYTSDRGVLVMDHGTFRRHFGDLPPTGMTAYLDERADPESVRGEILARLGEGHRAFIYTNRSLRTEVLRIFDSTFSITYALEIIAIFVAMLGVAGTLLTLVLERRRELVMLRLVGASQRHVRRIVVLEAVLIGAASQGVGLGVGFALSLLLIYVINVQSFGWTIQFHVPWAFLVQSSVAVLVATAVAGFFPARRAARLVMEREE
jgi:putative ABC transport system permease protein